MKSYVASRSISLKRYGEVVFFVLPQFSSISVICVQFSHLNLKHLLKKTNTKNPLSWRWVKPCQMNRLVEWSAG